jgi:hypothetical protein
MARSRITSPSKDLIKDNGSVLLSIVQGEQIHLNLTLGWLTNISSYTITCKVVEALNDGTGNVPTAVRTNGVVTNITLLDTTDTDNEFLLVVPETLSNNWTVQPSPNKPVYGYIDLEVKDTGVGARQQIWKPLRGLIEILYSPTEA